MNVPVRIAGLSGYLVAAALAWSQPASVEEGVRFSLSAPAAKSVSLVGDFNGWSGTPMTRGEDSVWGVVLNLAPGSFQYKFLVDGARYLLDPENPASVPNYNGSSVNSIFTLTPDGKLVFSSSPAAIVPNPADVYPAAPGKKRVFLNIIWHQHQPLYVNPESDCLTGPWVRTHATKDYYDMAAMLASYPKIHCTVNLTSTLLMQLQQYYVDRLGPYIDVRTGTMDVPAFLRQWGGKTDPWIDLALKPAETLSDNDKAFLYRNAWNAFGISEVMLQRFPEYLALKNKLQAALAPGGEPFTVQELREITCWFFLAYFDPDFLRGAVTLPDGSVCDLSDEVELRSDGKYYLRKKITEDDCRRMVVEAYKVMANVIPVHRRLRYHPRTREGQIEMITTPYCHPILPLLYDTDLARTCQPKDSLPVRFSYPQDADAQIAKAVDLYSRVFGEPPEGMWPGEGSVAQPITPLMRRNGIRWTASDVKVLQHSLPAGQKNISPYGFPAGKDSTIALVFRDTDLSDRIGFRYQDYTGEEAAEDFVQAVLALAPRKDEPDRLITVILDGENAWEWYRKDEDGKDFLHALYRKLTVLHDSGRIVTTTTAEYLDGNTARGIEPHPVKGLPRMQWLWPGSWINANFDTWIGEPEENLAWSYLLAARRDLQFSGVPRPDPHARAPVEGRTGWNAYKAWEEMYAAEGSDWFWWYGDDQSAPGGDGPFDLAFLTHLNNVYRFARRAGGFMPSRVFAPIVKDRGLRPTGQGTMAR